MKYVLALLIVVASHAAAEEPGYFAVSGLSGGDTLNVREMPNGRVIETLDQRQLVHSDGTEQSTDSVTWQKVSSGELDGWVSKAYLSRAEPIAFDGTGMPVQGSCSGFEPHWQVTWDETSLWFSLIGEAAVSGEISGVSKGTGTTTNNLITSTTGEAVINVINVIVEDKLCEFLPVDAALFGRATVIVSSGGTSSIYNGCCQPQPGGWE